MKAIVASELLLALKGRRWWWYAVAGAMFLMSLFVPSLGVRSAAAAIAWLWPVLIWSQMGVREARNATEPLIFSSDSPLRRQLPALWISGVAVAVLTGGGMGLNLLFTDNWRGFAGWIAGACFIPSLALALGVWTRTSKPFEVFYTILWYIGPMHQTPGIDFTGAAPTATSPVVYLTASAMLLIVAYCGRRARLAYA